MLVSQIFRSRGSKSSSVCSKVISVEINLLINNACNVNRKVTVNIIIPTVQNSLEVYMREKIICFKKSLV